MTDVNVPLLRKVLEHITAHPEEWNQDRWATQTSCGTAYCAAGHAVTMAGLDVDWTAQRADMPYWVTDGRRIADAAADLLGLESDSYGSVQLFDANNTLADLWCIANEVTDGAIELPAQFRDGVR